MPHPNLVSLAEPLSRAENWSAPASIPGDYVLTDPLTRQQLDPTTPPVWIAHDPVFAESFDYLKDRGPDLTFSIAYHIHEDAEGLGDMKRNWYERQVATADYYGYEAVDNTAASARSLSQEGRQVILQALALGEHPTREHFLKQEMLQAKGKADTYRARVLAAIALSGTPSFSFEMSSDGTLAEQATILAFRSALRHPDQAVAARAHLGLENAREWITVGRMATLLRCHEQDNDRPVSTFMTIGEAHEDVSRKLRLQGSVVKPYRIKTINQAQGSGEPMKQISSTGIILGDDMGWAVRTMQNVRSVATFFGS